MSWSHVNSFKPNPVENKAARPPAAPSSLDEEEIDGVSRLRCIEWFRCLRLAGEEEGVVAGMQAAVDAGAVPRRSGRVISRHPNASVALASGAGLGSVIVWSVGLAGVAMPAEVGAAFGGVVASGFLFVGRRGIRGSLGSIWRSIWRGSA